MVSVSYCFDFHTQQDLRSGAYFVATQKYAVTFTVQILAIRSDLRLLEVFQYIPAISGGNWVNSISGSEGYLWMFRFVRW